MLHTLCPACGRKRNEASYHRCAEIDRYEHQGKLLQAILETLQRIEQAIGGDLSKEKHEHY